MEIEVTEKDMEQYREKLGKAIRHVSQWYPLSNFKRFVSQFLLTENDEEQWTFDYQSYALSTYDAKNEGLAAHPMHWADEYYRERLDNKKYKESMENLKKIARREVKI